MAKKLERIGVFVCHCGQNIAGSVDVDKVVEEIIKYPGVVHAEHYMYMCSDPGQELIRQAIREKDLNGIINANCSPSLHEKTFRRVVSSEGINPYHQEVANIREHCSWPHSRDRDMATRKAIAIIKATVERLRLNMALIPSVIPLTKRALVIGAGMAGIQAALDIANSGYEVVLVERNPAIGGHAAQLSGTFLTLDNALCLVAPMIGDVINHPKITLYTYSEVHQVDGYVGNFEISVRCKATYVDEEKCNHCGLCVGACPASAPSEFDRGLSERKAIYFPQPEVVPHPPILEVKNCLRFNGGECNACQEVCPTGAIDYTCQDTIAEESVGAVIAAMGYDLFPRDRIGEYEIDPDVIDGLQFERMLSPNGPTGGKIVRPSDGKVPKEVVFIQCCGSRDPEHGVIYCSRVCCMYTAKQALLFKKDVPDGQAYVFYMDIRTDSKGFEQFQKQAVEEEQILYLRGRVSKVFRDGDKVKVWGTDTLTGKSVEIDADLVVLALGIVPSDGAKAMARELNIISDVNGFLTEAHLKLRPVETLTSGIYLAGTAQWPRDLPDTIASASGAASKVLSLFSRKELLHEPTIAFVDEDICVGCGQCVSVCTYKAIELDPKKKVAKVNEAVCEGCGACAATCPSKAMKHKNWTPSQFFEILDVATRGYT
ncbi:MAG: CoB--CoM heterodisulfide reductase iron-sulfur subunit A family protein [Chloroflexota bacterium]|nr:CoB--CoM heterodisulfide reductase iron-sulfur subunit A family protein [Chloroflexota bacterium]